MYIIKEEYQNKRILINGVVFDTTKEYSQERLEKLNKDKNYGEFIVFKSKPKEDKSKEDKSKEDKPKMEKMSFPKQEKKTSNELKSENDSEISKEDKNELGEI